MQKKEAFRLPKVGQRIVRSAAAVALCFGVYYLREKRGIPFYSALAALQCMQPYQDSTMETARKRVTGTFIGAFWGLALILMKMYGPLWGNEEALAGYLLISVFTGVVIYSTVLLNCKNTAYFSCVVFLSITVMHIADENPLLFVLNRILDTLIGVGLAFVVNSVHLPRKKQKDILFVSGIDDTILDSSCRLSPYSKVELNRIIDRGANFTVATIRTPASVREAMEGVKLKYPIIAMDGAVLYDLEANAYLMKYQMSPQQAVRMTEFLDGQRFRYFTNSVVDDLLVIYYSQLGNKAERGIFESKRRSPYRNYVKTDHPDCENVVYFLLIDEKEKIEVLYGELKRQPWFGDYRIVMADSVNFPGFAHIKIYHRDATKENMLRNLKALLNLERTVTFGSIQGKYDVYIDDADKNLMVKQLRNLYEPLWKPGFPGFHRRRGNG